MIHDRPATRPVRDAINPTSPREWICPVSGPSAIQLALLPDPFSRSIQTPVEPGNGRSGFWLPSEFTFAPPTDRSSRSTRTSVEAVNGRSVFSLASGLTSAPRRARPAAMPPFVRPVRGRSFSTPSTSVRLSQWRPSLDRNGTDHAGGASDPAIINRRDRRLACIRWFVGVVHWVGYLIVFSCDLATKPL